MPNTNRIYEQYKVYIDTVFRIELRKQRDAGIYVSHEDEEDLHQTILQKVLKYIPRHNPKKSTIKTYLYTIVKSQLKWQMINLYGMDGRPKSKEAWYRSFAKLDDEGFDYDAPATRSVDDVVASTAKLRFTAPWDRRKERNAYRKTLIALEQSRRALEESEDAVKNEVRAGYRDLVAARALYENKVEAYKVAQKRVESNDLFMQSGRSSMRDILEAESALLTAQNALCTAVVEWRMCDLALRTSMGILAVGDDGAWR